MFSRAAGLSLSLESAPREANDTSALEKMLISLFCDPPGAASSAQICLTPGNGDLSPGLEALDHLFPAEELQQTRSEQ